LFKLPPGAVVRSDGVARHAVSRDSTQGAKPGVTGLGGGEKIDNHPQALFETPRPAAAPLQLPNPLLLAEPDRVQFRHAIL
jgi:hypothetical protein